LILFGVRSPIVVDYEIAAQRSGVRFAYGVSVSGHPRTLSDLEIVVPANLGGRVRGAAIPCAFSPFTRKTLAEMALELGFSLADALIDATAILPPRLRIGRASFINAGVAVGGGSMFGIGVLINRTASIGHHSVLDDWVSIGPGAILSGNVRIGANSMIGAGAVIQSDIRIGANVRIAAGTVVRKHVDDNCIVSGNPGRSVRMRAVPSTLQREGEE
jgi:serine acetyltransferase